MKQVFYSFGLALVCIACGGENETVVVVPDIQPVKDSVVAEVINPISPELLAKFKKKTELPFVQDSTYLKKLAVKTKSNLTVDELNYLTTSFVESDIVPSAKYQLDDFFTMDSLLAAGEEEPVVESAEGVNIVSTVANVSEKVKLNDSTALLLWFICYSSTEGSPNAKGTVLYASLLINNEVTSCVAVGEDTYSSDVPYWSDITTTCSFTEEGYQSHRVLFDGGDTDEEENPVVTEAFATFALDIVDSEWEVARIE